MRKLSKKRIFVFVLCLSLLTSGTMVYAATLSRAITYNFTHYIPSGVVYVGQDGTIKMNLTTTTWGDSYFWVEQEIDGFFSDTYVDSKYVYKSNGNTQTISFSETYGTSYNLNFWKTDNDNSIVGSGTVTW